MVFSINFLLLRKQSFNMENESLRYPIGNFSYPETVSEQEIHDAIKTIAAFPNKLTSLVENLSEEALQYRYRPDGWTILQVIHHCADSHINSFTRFKGAIANQPFQIKGYDEKKWAITADVLNEPIQSSLEILKGLHKRWATFLIALNHEEWEYKLYHPESGALINVKQLLMNYAWHCEHHYAHVENAIKFQYS